MQQFSRREGVSLTTVGRWETMRPPSGKWLRRLYHLANLHGLAEIARVFEEAMESEKQQLALRLRKREILNPTNIWAAQNILLQLWEVVKRQPTKREPVLLLADRLLPGGRKQLDQ